MEEVLTLLTSSLHYLIIISSWETDKNNIWEIIHTYLPIGISISIISVSCSSRGCQMIVREYLIVSSEKYFHIDWISPYQIRVFFLSKLAQELEKKMCYVRFFFDIFTFFKNCSEMHKNYINEFLIMSGIDLKKKYYVTFFITLHFFQKFLRNA